MLQLLLDIDKNIYKKLIKKNGFQNSNNKMLRLIGNISNKLSMQKKKKNKNLNDQLINYNYFLYNNL